MSKLDTRFIDISGYDRLVPDIPDTIVLPVHGEQGPRVAEILEVKRGDEGWEAAVERYMFIRGFIKAPTKTKIRVIKGGPGSGHFDHAGRPGKVGGSAPSGTAVATPDKPTFKTAAPTLFVSHLNKHLDSRYKAFVTVYSAKEYAKMGARCFVSDSGQSGYAIKPDGDIISVFAKSGSGEGRGALVSAILNGGSKLDCFDGFLPQFYTQFGFVEYDRWTWDDQYAPPGWDYKKFGRPDVVLMKLQGPDKTSKEDKSVNEELEKAQREYVDDVFGGELTQEEQEEIAKIVKRQV